jgi:uncharacterized protein (DUF885 family)
VTAVKAAFLGFAALSIAHLYAQASRAPDDGNNPVSNITFDQSNSPLRPLIERFANDRTVLNQYYDIRMSADRRERFRRFYHDWQTRLATLNFERLNEDGQIDCVLFRNYLDHALRQLDFDAAKDGDSASYIPFASTIIGLEEARRNGHAIDSQATAATLSKLPAEIQTLQQQEERLPAINDPAALQARRIASNRAADQVELLRKTLHHWYAFYHDYDPLFTWWNTEPYGRADAALNEHSRFLKQKIAGVNAHESGEKGSPAPAGHPKSDDDQDSFNLHASHAAKPGDTSDIIGDPIGREGLLAELSYEMIPYTPEELIAVANQEFAWCEDQMRRASNEMGFGNNWKQALEKVKNMYVEPGKQPQLIRDLEQEAEVFVTGHNLVTIPPLASETWRMQMMSPERQLINPFFTGGDTISVSYPTEEMTYEQKMMSMRGNNIPFSRATVFHELIPGHELQLFMADRYHAYRRDLGSTPFAVEGWSLYWELILWDMKFQKTPEDRIGALFWRMHRCARIIFSLSFHLGKMTPDQCVDFLVDRVGHERENAIAEVRRSVAGQDGPLYQAAYLLGGMQLYSLHTSLVGSHKMTDKEFNDAVLQENMMPVELTRASLTHQKLTRDFKSGWKFLANGPIPGVQ